MKIGRSIVVKDSKGETIKVYKNISEASKRERVSRETLRRAIIGKNSRKLNNGKTYEWGDIKKDRYQFRSRVVIIDERGKATVYNTQTELAKKLGVTLASVNHYVHGRSKPKGYRVLSYDEYLSKYGEKKEITKRTERMLFINVLVGLANGTLEDGTIFVLNNKQFEYSKKQEALLYDGLAIWKKELIMEEVEAQLPLLLEKEKDFLRNLLKAFERVDGITKCDDMKNGLEFIRIETPNEEKNISLPSFKEGKYYTGLEKNRTYTLDELGL